MKLLFLTVMPSPYQQQLFAAMAAADGFSVTVRYFTAGALDREWFPPVLAAYEKVMAGSTLSFLGSSAHWNPLVVAEVASVSADLVIVSDYSAPTAQLAMRWLIAKRHPFVFWGEIPGFARRGRLGAYVRRQLQVPLASAAAIAAIGTSAVDAYRALFPGKPVYNIPYFCDLLPYREARAAAEPRVGATVDILFSGQMIERKGVDLLIEAFAAVAKDIPRLRLKLLGGGSQKDRFSALVPTEFAERVVFLGHHEPAELPSLFASADVFCLPSRHDGWGVVVNEALGAGLPLIVSDAVGAGRDLVRPEVNGIVVPACDAVALAAALRRIANDGIRAKMASAAREIAVQWEISEGVARWREAAHNVLARG
jgi:glycosyltransferase involved in cell wall biosynthesis